MNKIKKTLEKALIEAGLILKRAIDRPKTIEYKSPVSLVTKTDKLAEKRIIDVIKRNFPDHEILAEESYPTGDAREKGTGSDVLPVSFSSEDRHCEEPAGRRGNLRARRLLRPYGARNDKRCKWIIDPLDGTANFAHGLRLACISIAYEEAGIVKVGGVWNPFLNEWFWAERGKGASLNGKRIRVSKSKRLKESMLVTGFPYDRIHRADYYLKFMKSFMVTTHGIRRLGSAAMDLCYVACGRFDGYWEFKLQPWDQAAGVLIVQEAGGCVSDFHGRAMNIYGNQTLATNGKIHAEMLKVIRKHL